MWFRVLRFTVLPRTPLWSGSSIFALSSHTHTLKDIQGVAVGHNGGSQNSPMTQALQQIQSGDHSGALETLSLGIEGQKSVKGCLVNAAACCAALGNHLSALDFALTGVLVDPVSDPAWYRAVCAAVDAGKVGEAMGLSVMAPERVRKRAQVLIHGDAIEAEDPFMTFITRVPMLLKPATGEEVNIM